VKETLNLLLDRVMVKRLPISEGGLVIPEKFAEQPDRGRVLAVGPGRAGVPMTLKVGDKVLLDKAASAQLTKVNDEEVLILYEAEIAGTFE
jgi:chaperonin GroES